MGFTRFNFTKLWTSPTDFPTVETDETQVRADMQDLHDQSKDGLNSLMTELEWQSAAEHLGARTAGGTGQSTVQAQLDALHADSQTRASQTQVDDLEKTSHTHENAAVVDATEVSLTKTLAAAYDRLVTLLKGITSVVTTLGLDDTTIPTSKAVQNAITASGNMPAGGGSGQALTKASGSDYDYQWADLAPASHASQHASGGSDAITPASIGAVNRAGDTVPAQNFYINGGTCRFQANNNAFWIYTAQSAEEISTDKRYLALYNKGFVDEVSAALKLNETIGGVTNSYTILHTGNLSALNVPKMVSGYYVGNGNGSERTISLGITPDVVILRAASFITELSYEDNTHGALVAVTGSPVYFNEYNSDALTTDDIMLEIVSDGFKVYETSDSRLNTDGIMFNYVALCR